MIDESVLILMTEIPHGLVSLFPWKQKCLEIEMLLVAGVSQDVMNCCACTRMHRDTKFQGSSESRLRLSKHTSPWRRRLVAHEEGSVCVLLCCLPKCETPVNAGVTVQQ